MIHASLSHSTVQLPGECGTGGKSAVEIGVKRVPGHALRLSEGSYHVPLWGTDRIGDLTYSGVYRYRD